MFYNFDVIKWVRQQLPPMLRRDGLFALLQCLVWPLGYIYNLFALYIKGVRQQLSYNAFTIYLERFLNGLFGLDHGIYIIDYRIELTTYLAKHSEQMQPDYFSRYSETVDIVYISNSDMLAGGFNIMIPASLATEDNIALIKKWVNYYKFAGTTFTIKQY